MNKSYHVIGIRWEAEKMIQKKIGCSTLDESYKIFAKMIKRKRYQTVHIEAYGVKI